MNGRKKPLGPVDPVRLERINGLLEYYAITPKLINVKFCLLEYNITNHLLPKPVLLLKAVGSLVGIFILGH